MVVTWNQDVGRLGLKVADYLDKKLKGRELAEISPEGFFSLSGVSVEDDIAQFPESKFYWCQEKSLVIFRSDIPRYDWYEFLSLVLDIAEKYCKVKEIYTIGGMVSPSAHTTTQMLLSVANSTNIKKMLSRHDIVSNMDYETRDDQRPTFSSYLLWAASREHIPAASLWMPVPFYLMAVEDLRGCRRVVEFLNNHLELDINLADMDEEVARQNKKIAQARSQFPELDGYISKLENNLGLTVDESEKLVREIEEWLKRSH
jgi:predicted ATP-grasp superfamily ATP-dependent carboligase